MQYHAIGIGLFIKLLVLVSLLVHHQTFCLKHDL